MGKRPDSQSDYYKFPAGGVIISQCAMCKNKDEDGATCAAFPDGIPDEILNNKKDHREPIKGDHGIQFDPEFKGEFPEIEKE